MRNPMQFPKNEAHFFIFGSVGELEVKTSEPKTAAYPATLICCHPHPLYEGTMENKVVTTVFRTFRDLGLHVVRFNYRGVGKSAGSYGEALGETDDLLAVIHWVKSVRPDDQIWLAGFSFGAYVVYRAASLVDIQQLIMIAPPVQHFDFSIIDPPACPSLVIQGEEDEIVPPTEVYAWLNSLANPPSLLKLENTSHFFHGKLVDLKDLLQERFKQQLD